MLPDEDRVFSTQTDEESHHGPRGERLIQKAEPPLASRIPFPAGFRAQT